MATRSILARSPDWVTARTRKAGAVYVGLAAAIDGLSALWLVTNAGTDAATQWLIGLMVGTLGEFGALVSGGTIDAILGLVAPALGVGLAVVGTMGALAALDAYRGFRFRRSAAIGILVGLNPLAMPLALLGVVHLGLARRTFASV